MRFLITFLRTFFFYLVHVSVLSFITTSACGLWMMPFLLVTDGFCGDVDYLEYGIVCITGCYWGAVAKRFYGRLPFLFASLLAVWWMDILGIVQPELMSVGLCVGFLQPLGKRKTSLTDLSMPWLQSHPVKAVLLILLAVLYSIGCIHFLDVFQPYTGGVMHSRPIQSLHRAYREASMHAFEQKEPVMLSTYLLKHPFPSTGEYFVRKGPMHSDVSSGEILAIYSRQFSNIHDRNIFKTPGFAYVRVGGGIDFLSPEAFQALDLSGFDRVSRE